MSETQFRKAIQRIMRNEIGVFEKCVEHFDLTEAEMFFLMKFEQYRVEGKYLNNEKDIRSIRADADSSIRRG